MKLDKVWLDDFGHFVWALWLTMLMPALPPGIYVGVAIFGLAIPRELLQTFNALEEKSIPGIRRHIRSKPGWLKGKLRDIAGFAAGGLVTELWMSL